MVRVSNTTQTTQTSSSSYSSIPSSSRLQTGSCHGFPKKCFCGLDPVMRTSTTIDNPGRRFYGCRNYLDGGYHIMKWWDEAMMEEFQDLKLMVEKDGEQRESVAMMHAEVQKTQTEIALLKELMSDKPSPGDVRRHVELKNMILSGLILIVLMAAIVIHSLLI